MNIFNCLSCLRLPRVKILADIIILINIVLLMFTTCVVIFEDIGNNREAFLDIIEQFEKNYVPDAIELLTFIPWNHILYLGVLILACLGIKWNSPALILPFATLWFIYTIVTCMIAVLMDIHNYKNNFTILISFVNFIYQFINSLYLYGYIDDLYQYANGKKKIITWREFQSFPSVINSNPLYRPVDEQKNRVVV